MRVLFAQNMIHVPAHGGANKANRILAELLAAQGHECHLVAPLTGALRTGTGDAADQLARHGVPGWERDDDALVYHLGGVQVHAVPEPARLVRRIRTVAARLRPDWIVVPSDDPAGMVLAAALAAAPGRVIYLAYTIQQLPCGPASFQPSPARTAALRRTAGVLAISHAIRDYLAQWAEVESELLYPPVYGPVPRIRPSGPESGAVTLINPCGYKGLPVFLGLADTFPAARFLAVPTWGTTAEDRAALHRRPNVEVTDPADDIERILRSTRILLVPSLWDETFGFSCVDAMLRGIPVLASAVGGLPEAKLGVPYLLPVRRIERYDVTADPARPVPLVPDQNLDPWRAALSRLLDDPAHFDDIAQRSRNAAVNFVASLDRHALAGYLLSRTPLQADPVGADGTAR